jgi:hypothetical protein
VCIYRDECVYVVSVFDVLCNPQKKTMISRPKKRGLGVKDLRKMDVGLLCKWWWKFEYRDCLWQNCEEKVHNQGRDSSIEIQAD